MIHRTGRPVRSTDDAISRNKRVLPTPAAPRTTTAPAPSRAPIAERITSISSSRPQKGHDPPGALTAPLRTVGA